MNTHENATKVTQTSPQPHPQPACETKPPRDEQDRTTAPAEQPSTVSGQAGPPTPDPTPQHRELTFEHKDFICKHIAAFRSYKEVAGLFLAEFPDSGFTFDQVLKRIKYYSCDNRTRKWRFRIIEYRRMLNHNLANRFRLANKYERLRHLEEMFHEAMQVRVKRLFWYPLRRRKDDKITYRKFKVRERDLALATRILSLIAKELDPESLEALEDPYMLQRRYQDPEAFADEVDAFRRQDPEASRDLDKTFGLI